jgi:hypothetical protein
MRARRLAVVVIVMLFAVGCFGLANTQASVLLVDRGLPTANLNNAAGADRSNVNWGFTPNNTYFSGDDFQLPTGQWRIDSLTIWGSAGAPGDTSFHLADRYTQITLYGGLATDGVSAIASGSFVANTNVTTNANIVITPVTYAGGSNYQGSSGAYIQLWRVDFTNLGWVVDGNTLYQFGVQGLTVSSDDYWFNHASNAALGGVAADGADNLFRWFDVTNLAQLDPPGTGSHYDNSFDSAATIVDDGYYGGWDKSSDINVEISGTAIPEPATIVVWGLLGVAAAGYGVWRRRAG